MGKHQNAKKLFWLTLAVCLVLVALPFVFFGKELFEYTLRRWYFDLIALGALIFMGQRLYTTYKMAQDEDDENGPKFGAVGVAILFAIILLWPSAQYRADKADNIEYKSQ